MNAEQKNNSQLKIRTAKLSFVIGFLLLFIKFSAYFITDSAAIFSDAMESITHLFATGVTLFSIILSSKPADKDHPYGHGNIEYFSAGFEGLLIIFAGIIIIYSSVERIILGIQPLHLGTGLILIIVSSIIILVLSLYVIHIGKTTNSLALIADGKHILTDAYTSLGIIIGLGIVMITDIFIFDPIIAIIIASNIFYTGYKLIKQAFSGLMNEIDPTILYEITDKLISIKKPFWIDVHELRYWKSANSTFIDFHLVLPYYFSIKQSHDSDDLIAFELKSILPESQVKIHLDYCNFDICKFCAFKDCSERKDDLLEEYKWDQERLTGPGLRKIYKIKEP